MIRRAIRRTVPLAVRVQVAAYRRRVRDWRSGARFAHRREQAGTRYPFVLGEYRRVFIDYPGQEHLGAAKRRNQAILAGQLDGVVVRPGETFAVWSLAARPSKRQGYSAAAALKDGELIQEIGGAICLLSTVLYNAALLGGMVIVERWCHSVDSYGEARYFDLGRDAAIEYGYRDLRFRNPFDQPVLVSVRTDDGGVTASIYGTRPGGFQVEFEVMAATVPPRHPPGAFAVTTTRVTHQFDGRTGRENLGLSVYHPPAGV
jgi:hypothetical protein